MGQKKMNLALIPKKSVGSGIELIIQTLWAICNLRHTTGSTTGDL